MELNLLHLRFPLKMAQVWGTLEAEVGSYTPLVTKKDGTPITLWHPDYPTYDTEITGRDKPRERFYEDLLIGDDLSLSWDRIAKEMKDFCDESHNYSPIGTGDVNSNGAVDEAAR